MQFVDKAFARRLEAVEEMPQLFYSRIFQTSRPKIGAAEEEICGGHMVFAGLGSPIGRATGLGLDRPFTAQDLDRVEQFYRAHQAPAQVDLCPLHHPAVFEMFKERGYAIAELNNVLYRRLDAKEEFPAGLAGCEIRRGLPEEAEAAGAIVEQAFFPEGAPDPVSRARTADGAAARTHGGGRRQGVRVRGGGHTGRDDLAAQLRTAGLPRGVQQGDGYQELALVNWSCWRWAWVRS
jgi:hypothetical protein